MSNSLDPDQARRFVGPDLGPNCLPRLSADDTGRQVAQPKEAQEDVEFNDKMKLDIDITDPQNHSEWRGHLL